MANSSRNISMSNLNKFDPIKGIETRRPFFANMRNINLNKFDPIKGIETYLANEMC